MEVFKDVIGYEGFYRISNKGNVYSIRGNKILKQQPHHTNKYMCVTISIDNNRKLLLVHRMVAKAFIQNPENKLTVNHIDGNKSNNNIENLEWCTQQENVVHALKTGLTIRKKGECAYTARVVGKFLNNVLVKKYNCIDMSKCDGHKINAVRHSIQSGNTHHGFNWKYLDSKPVSRKKYSTNKPFASFKDGEMVKLYNNSIEALEDGLWLSNIYKCIRGGINSYKKLQWKYV